MRGGRTLWRVPNQAPVVRWMGAVCGCATVYCRHDKNPLSPRWPAGLVPCRSAPRDALAHPGRAPSGSTPGSHPGAGSRQSCRCDGACAGGRMACGCTPVRPGGDPLRAHAAASTGGRGACGNCRGLTPGSRCCRARRCRAHSGADRRLASRRPGDLPDVGRGVGFADIAR